MVQPTKSAFPCKYIPPPRELAPAFATVLLVIQQLLSIKRPVATAAFTPPPKSALELPAITQFRIAGMLFSILTPLFVEP